MQIIAMAGCGDEVAVNVCKIAVDLLLLQQMFDETDGCRKVTVD